jgi:hypothetical protein
MCVIIPLDEWFACNSKLPTDMNLRLRVGSGQMQGQQHGQGRAIDAGPHEGMTENNLAASVNLYGAEMHSGLGQMGQSHGMCLSYPLADNWLHSHNGFLRAIILS